MEFNQKIILINEIVIFFDRYCKKPIEDATLEILDYIKNSLDTYGNDFSLITINSVHTIRYYNITHRIKKDISIFEKFIRKSVGLKIIEQLDLKKVDDIETKKEELMALLLGYEDIIGVKIVTELKADCKNVYELLKNHKNELEDITFRDFDKQPKLMRNGLPIYNIKGIFKGKYGFELQIKSKIDSAWGDLDHGLFYKNYTYNPIKDTAQITMNHVGNLLDEIENLLFSIRESNKYYSSNIERIVFIDNLYKVFSKHCKDLTQTPYRFEKIADLLLFLFKKVGNYDSILDVDIELSTIGIDYLDFQYDSIDEVCKFYLALRDTSFDLIILENIYLQWVYTYSPKEVNHNSYIDIIKDLIQEEVVEYLEQKVSDENDVVRQSFPKLIKYVKSDEIFFSLEKHHTMVKYEKMLADIEMDFEKEDYLSRLLTIFGIKIFNGDYIEYSNIMMEELDHDIDLINTIYEQMAMNIKRMEEENPEYNLFKDFIKINHEIFNELVKLEEV